MAVSRTRAGVSARRARERAAYSGAGLDGGAVRASRLRTWSCCLKACDKVERKVAANFLSSDLFMALMIITDVEALRG